MALYCSKELVNPREKSGVAGHGLVVTALSVPRSAQAIKKGGRECRQQQGVERVENAGLSPAAPPSSGGHGCRGCSLHTAKKGEVPPPPSSTHCPFTEEAPKELRGVHLLVVAITTKRLMGSATQEKAEVPPSALFDALDPLTEG